MVLVNCILPVECNVVEDLRGLLQPHLVLHCSALDGGSSGARESQCRTLSRSQ